MQITQSPNNTPELSLTIKSSVSNIWDALRDKEKLLQWHGWDTPDLEAEIENIYFTDAKEDAASSQKRTLTVNGGDTFIIETADDGAKLTLVRAGLSGDPEWDSYYDNITEGWVSFIEQLRFMLEQAPETARKTTFSNLTLDRNEVLAQLNLTEEKAGTQYAGHFQGDEISGEVWFSTPDQLGLAVDAWGPGLLILQFSQNGCIATRYNA